MSLKSDDSRLFEEWKEYERIAMHFNDLLIRLRVQAMGGLALLVTLGGLVVQAQEEVNYRGMFLLAFTFLSAWIGIAVLDLFYYRRLLQGAVESILKLERRLYRVTLSTNIERHAVRGAAAAPWIFYGAGLVPLLLILVWALTNVLG